MPFIYRLQVYSIMHSMSDALKHFPFFRATGCFWLISIALLRGVDMKTYQMTDLCFEACKVLTRNIQWVVTLACSHLEAFWNMYHSKSAEFLWDQWELWHGKQIDQRENVLEDLCTFNYVITLAVCFFVLCHLIPNTMVQWLHKILHLIVFYFHNTARG